MCDISARIDTLNRQLVTISKLQKMGEDYSNVCLHASYKNSNGYNAFGKLCHCAHRVLSLKEQCSRLGCAEECMSHDNSKRRLPCNSRTCKTRRKLYLHKNTPLLEEVPQELKNNVKISKSASVNIHGDTNESPELQEKQSKSGQVNLTTQFHKMDTQDKIIDTYEEKSEQTIPTRDYYVAELSIQSSLTNHAEPKAASKETVEEDKVEDNGVSNELGELYHTIEDVCVKDKKVFERIEKDLYNEEKRTKDLEKKLKSLTCSLNSLREHSEQRAACLKGALETAKEQTKVAMDLVKQSKDQAELVKADREVLLNEIAKLQQQVADAAQTNICLLQERDKLKSKLQSLSEDESRRCEEVELEVSRMKHAVKEKEMALNKERTEFMDMILELTNVINIQKRRICEVSGVCNNQQYTIQEKEKELSQKNAELSEIKSMLQSSDSTIKEMEEKVHNLEYCLCEESKACDCTKQELETLKENHSSEQRIKDKIIEEQNKTISKQRKLLRDSEEMVQQVAAEFDELKDELHKEKQKCKSLQITLDHADSKLSEAYMSQCEQCKILTDDISNLKKEKQRALAVAKLASQKLHQTEKQYENKLVCERQQVGYLKLIIRKKDQEIACLRSQLCPAMI